MSMSNIVRALIEEAEKIEAPPDLPLFLTEAVKEGETVVGVAPIYIRQYYTLARDKAQKMIDMAKAYESQDDPDGSILMEINRLQQEAYLLEGCADTALRILFVRESGCQGDVDVRAAWQVVWYPCPSDEDDDEGDEDEESGEEDARPVRQKRVLNS